MSTEPLTRLLVSRVAPDVPTPMVGALLVPDTELPDLPGSDLPVALVNTGGAGQIAGPAGLAVRRELTLASVTTTVADPADPAGNVRRIVAAVEAARAEGAFPGDVVVRVQLPPEPAHHGWQAAADEIAAAEFEAALPVTVRGGAVPPPLLVEWIDALLDRETGFAAIDVSGGGQVVGVLAATAALWDGLGPEEAAARLATPAADAADLGTGRRWCRAVHVEDGPGTATELTELLR